ncbi:MAG: 50S ribosomal protein L4 [Desulfatibacillum sp.]|nr:50S ribosomal protein L4 [Desulfatibacillum sp.]
MAKVEVCNLSGEKVSEIDLTDEIFGVEVKVSVLHEVVVMQLANRRAGTVCVKNRSDVRGSTRKLYRQKGTGRARKGDIKSPLLRGGGVVFGPHPRDYSYKVPKKVRRSALRMALTTKLADNQLKVVDDMELPEIKTKAFTNAMAAMGVKNVLIVTKGTETNLELSARNVRGVKVLPIAGLNVYDILKYGNLILAQGAIEDIEGRLL